MSRTNWLFVGGATLASTFVLAWLPVRRLIPPLIESDYCYLLLAAQRFLAGEGLTSLQPVAPFQPWTPAYEWGFLTQWPVGYSILVAAASRLFGCTLIEACEVISVLGSAAGFVGWFTLLHRSTPNGITGIILALLGATTGLSAALLVNPSTDLILIAILPFALLLTLEGLPRNGESQGRMIPFIAAGVLAGVVVWFRYAGIFVPLAVGSFLIAEWARKRIPVSFILGFSIPGTMFIAGLVLVNTLFGPTKSASETFNLGSSLGFEFSPSMLWRAWWTFTDLGFYSHRPVVHYVFALLPLALIPALLSKSARQSFVDLFATAPIRLAFCTVVMLLGLVIWATILFRGKFEYIGLDRYYLPVRPLFVLLVVAPILLIPRRVVRAGLSCVLLMLLSWTVFQDWAPTLVRWSSAHRAATATGSWSRIFEPNSEVLYNWVQVRGKDPSVLILSNFHEFVAFETGIGTMPLPHSKDELCEFIRRTQEIRRVTRVKPVFVLHPENLWRNHWLPDVDSLKEALGLVPLPAANTELRPYLFIPEDRQWVCEVSLTSISWN